MNELTYVTSTRRKKKPGPTARRIAKRRRAEGPVIKAVRAACVERDGYCRYWKDVFEACCVAVECTGPSEWAHLESRARTRNMKPELRHNTATSLMLCKFHHDKLDGRRYPRIRVELLTGHGADGPLNWRTT